jgi:hypothetical protein
MKSNLGKFLAVGSLVVGGAALAASPAKAALVSGSTLQFNASLVFFDADPAAGNALTVLFTENYNDFSSVALVGDYGEFDILGSSDGSFAPYVTGVDPTSLEVLSLAFPSLVPTTILGFANVYIGGPGPIASLPGSSLTPDVSPFTTPVLRLDDADDADTPIEFFIDEVTSFFDNVPAGGPTFSYTFAANGAFRDDSGAAQGSGTLNGTFEFGNSIIVDLGTGTTYGTGDACAAAAADPGDCVGALTSTFGATFVVEESVPESSPVSALIGFGLVGSAFALKRKARLN